MKPIEYNVTLRNRIYYMLKPVIPRALQIALRRMILTGEHIAQFKDRWPINHEIPRRRPAGWDGWEHGKEFALVLTHDVEKKRGQHRCRKIAALEKELGFISSFNFVPERYEVSTELMGHLMNEGFEIGVHDLNHDGKLFRSEKLFKSRSDRINRYLRMWNAKGFRAGAMHHNLEWFHHLEIEYDASTFDTDPFEPQPDAVDSIFPLWIPDRSRPGKGYVELPYTLPQDFCLFVIMREPDIGVWKKKLDWIAQNGAMALLIVHPDYTSFEGSKRSVDEYPAAFYREFLTYVKTRYSGRYWNAVPSQIAAHWKKSVLF